jgi:acetyl esterase/lipase
MFKNAPYYPESLTDLVYSGPQVSAATPVLDTAEVPPRDAWLSNAFKSGKHLQLVTKDGDFERIDPSKHFSAQFPPTMFIHGNADTVTPVRISERAHQELAVLGVETEILRVEGADHMFDLFIGSDDDGFKRNVAPGLAFLSGKVGL